jgi:hypothetical protein
LSGEESRNPFPEFTKWPVTAVCCLSEVSGFAQVGEWLKPTDCKSVPPSEVRRFESFPVHQLIAENAARGSALEKKLEIKKKFGLALVAYVVLGILAWSTLSNEPIPLLGMNVNLRDGTLVILGLFAFRAALYYWRVRIEEKQERESPQ